MKTAAISKCISPYFIEALDLRNHPIKASKKKIRAEYFTALKYLIEKTVLNTGCTHTDASRYIESRLSFYYTELFADTEISTANEQYCVRCLSLCVSKPWRAKYRYLLLCDIALILLDKPLFVHAVSIVNTSLSQKRQKELEQFLSLLFSSQELEKKHLIAAPLVKQYRMNSLFLSQPEQRIIVTANMSAGKSTLINALVGKPIARTSQEVCTGNVCYLFNKAYEDEKIHLKTQDINLAADPDDLRSYAWDGHISIASFFIGAASNVPRVCMIDTPGVDAALYRAHSKLAHKALLEYQHDTIVYVISPNRLGTDSEKAHLQWVSKNLPKSKIIFVLNKLDDYRDFSDSIEESINGLREDLRMQSFDNPIICPISAYFSYLLKLKMNGYPLTEDEEEEFALYSKKFKRSTYDLSRYYDVECQPDDSDEVLLSKRAGLYGLEKILYGG